MPPRDIYLLSPRALSPETIAVAFAKTSRSPESFRAIAAELSEEKSAQFHEKWVVGYGHASVAEHAVLHLAFENVSRLAIECIESNRLASYTEKSTRYQKWEPDDFTVPPELVDHPLKDEFIQTCHFLFQTYADSLAPVRNLIVEKTPRRDNESEAAWDRRVRSQYVDTCRFILPAAANANLGMTANARILEGAIRKMLSHDLAEVREIGETVKQVARAETPTLVKYADAVPYLVETARGFNDRSQPPAATSPGPDHRQSLSDRKPGDWCRLLDYDPQAENKVLAAAVFRYGGLAYADALDHICALPQSEREGVADLLLAGLGEHDIPLRELEFCTVTFELLMDQGAYAEFKRHRMMTQTPQSLTTRLGYAIPRLIAEAGFQPAYDQAMQAASTLFEKLYAFSPVVAQYIVPNGYNRRVLAHFNLREAFHFCQLRAAKNAHFSIRRLALGIFEELSRVHPLLTRYMHLPPESWADVEQANFVRI
jgi:thymidylate synthase ThyX